MLQQPLHARVDPAMVMLPMPNSSSYQSRDALHWLYKSLQEYGKRVGRFFEEKTEAKEGKKESW